MNLRDLAALLTARTADHILTLRPGDTGSAAIDDLLSRNFPKGALVIEHANQKQDQTSVTVRGQMTLFGVPKVNVAAVFYVQGDTAEVRVECDLPTYAFSDTTPNLSD